MLAYFQKKYALSPDGSKTLLRSIAWTFLRDISFVLPILISLLLLDNQLRPQAGPSHEISYYILLSAILFLVMFAISYCQYNATFTKIYDESSQRRIQLAETLRKLPLAFFAKKDIADLSSTIMEDATQIETLFSHSVPHLYSAFMIIVFTGTMLLLYQWQLALALLWVIPIALLSFLLSRKIQNRVHSQIYFAKRNISDQIQESLDLAQEIKSYNLETAFANKIDTLLNHYEKIMIKNELLLGTFINLSYSFLRLGLPSVLLYGAYLLFAGHIDLFTYLVFLLIAARIYDPLIEAMNNLALLIYLQIRIQRMKELDHMPRQEGRTNFSPANHDIVFENVDFSYQEGVQTLHQVSFTAKQGEVTALVGPSGGGKSTVAKLAARFWDINKGRITLGGEDISLIDPETLLHHYSIVFQDVILFNSSVLDNIRLGKKDASEQEILQAAQLAQCDDFVKKLPQGYHTLIGENGEKLSGGERQRISIARAILKDAPIILLDEATASLDVENESKIQEALSELIKNKTVIMIAHRMRTVLHADKIVVIKEGTITESGSPAELKDKDGLFAAMLERQFQSIPEFAAN